MILQTDPLLKPKIQKFGCYFLSILFWVNRMTGRGFNQKAINDLYDLLPDIWLGRDCYVKSPLDIFKFLRFNVTRIKKEWPNYECDPGEIEVLCFERTYTKGGRKKTYNHFTCGDGGVVTYDPAGRSNAVRHGKLQSKRIFTWKSG